MSEEWGPWKIHEGGPCPCVGHVVHIVVGFSDGYDPMLDSNPPDGLVIEVISNAEWVQIAEDDSGWRWEEGVYPVIRYRIRKPRGMTVLEEIAQGVRQPEDA
jgi:hypothetical protein